MRRRNDNSPNDDIIKKMDKVIEFISYIDLDDIRAESVIELFNEIPTIIKLLEEIQDGDEELRESWNDINDELEQLTKEYNNKLEDIEDLNFQLKKINDVNDF